MPIIPFKGFVSKTAFILHAYENGITSPSEISRLADNEISVKVISAILQNHREKRRARLKTYAQNHGMHYYDLCNKLLDIIDRDGMIEAILDGE